MHLAKGPRISWLTRQACTRNELGRLAALARLDAYYLDNPRYVGWGWYLKAFHREKGLAGYQNRAYRKHMPRPANTTE